MVNKHKQCNSIVVATWNANGIRQKTEELLLFLDEEDVSILLVSETLLKPTVRQGLRGFQGFRKDREGRGGGVAVFVRNGMAARQIPMETTIIESVAVEVEIGEEKTRFVAVYNRPRAEITRDDLLLLMAEQNTIVGGDLNAKDTRWGCRTTNKAGRVLTAFVEEFKGIRVLAPEDATTIPQRANYRGEILDIFIAGETTSPREVTTKFTLASDHLPVTLKLGGPPVQAAARQRTDWGRFADGSKRIPAAVGELQEDQIDAEADTLTKEIQAVLLECKVPIHKTMKNPLGLSTDEKALIRQKHQAKKIWAKFGRERDKLRLRQLERDVKVMLSEARERKWSDTIEAVEENPGRLWTVLKKIGRSYYPNSPIHAQGQWWYSDRDRAERAAEFLEDSFNNHLESDNRTTNTVKRSIIEITSTPAEIPPEISLQDLKKHIARRSVKKAPGEDGICNKALKLLDDNPLSRVCRLINSCRRYGTVPRCWKTATIVLLPKREKDPSKLENRRPISLINCMAKLGESFLKRDLESFADDNELWQSSQFGFRADLSAIQQAANLIEATKRMSKPRYSVLVALLDVQKAYDRVWRDGLLHKLWNHRFPVWLLRFLHAWLAEREFRVRVGTEYSSWKTAREGLPQGSPLSPALYNLFVGDFPQFKKMKNTRLFQFADDTAILTASNSFEKCQGNMEKALQQVSNYSERWKIRMNATKTEVLLFGKKQPKRSSIRFEGKNIPLKPTARYLGIQIDRKLQFVRHTKSRGAAATRRLNRLYPILGPDSRLSVQNRLKVMRSIAEPMAFFGQEVAIDGSEKAKQLMHGRQTTLLRKCLAAPWFMHVRTLRDNAKLEDIVVKATRRRKAMAERMRDHPDTEIQNMGGLIS